MAKEPGLEAVSGDAEAAQPQDAPRSGPPPQYWLRVHGYPSDLTNEVVSSDDFADLMAGALRGDPSDLLKVGDVIIYYADGPSSLYGLATIVDAVHGVYDNERHRQTWTVPTKRDAIIKAINKAPHAVGLEPPSGRHFLSLVRSYTYIRLPEKDGEYLVGQVKSRAGSKD